MMGVSKWFSLIPHFFTTLCLTVTYALTPELSGKDSHKARFVTVRSIEHAPMHAPILTFLPRHGGDALEVVTSVHKLTRDVVGA